MVHAQGNPDASKKTLDQCAEILGHASRDAIIIRICRVIAWNAFSWQLGFKSRIFILFVVWSYYGLFIPGLGPILESIVVWYIHDDPHPPQIVSRRDIERATGLYVCIYFLAFNMGVFFHILKVFLLPPLPYAVFYISASFFLPAWTLDFTNWLLD
jgi:hypothetical protein